MMRPSQTRRQMLGGLGATVGGSAVVGGAATQIHIDPIVTWEPAPGTWPYHRYDSGQTAANPHASPPADPEIVWQTTFPGDGYRHSFVVGSDRVYASKETVNDVGTTLTALNRRDGTAQWQTVTPVDTFVLYDGTLYTYGGGVLTALDAETGQSHWRTRASATESGFLLVTADTIFVDEKAYDIQDGSHKWSSTRHTDDVEQFVAQDGSLFGYDEHKVIKFRPRNYLEVGLGMGPSNAWKIDKGGQGASVRDDLLIRWGYYEPPVVAIDTESGERVWSTLVPTDVVSIADDSGGAASEYEVEARQPAITASRGIVGAEASASEGLESIHAVVGFSTTDGSILWQRSLEKDIGFLNDIVVANDTVLLAHGEESKSDIAAVQALDAATGREQWRVSTEYEPVQIAAVDKTIFAKTEPDHSSKSPRIIALR